MNAAGLEGVFAAKSAISSIDGQAGRLSYRGYNIHDLAAQSNFEEAAYLLWYGTLPNRRQWEALKADLAANRTLPDELIRLFRGLPLSSANPMAFLRTAVSLLSLYDPESEESSRDANFRKAIRLASRMPTIVASFDRLRRSQEVVPPRSDLGQAANFLFMLTGREPDPVSSRMLDTYFVLLADHEMNPSTFAARVTTATLSDIYSAVTSAIGALKGPIHGGANERTMEMLLKIDDVERAEDYVRCCLQRKERIMGFGHRVYKTEDPRATHLRRLSQDIGKKTGQAKWFQMSKRIEDMMRREKGLNANVDYYSASMMYLIGIPVDLFTPTFACSRIPGWTAHILEQQADNRLIRPRSEYIGPRELTYVPMDRR